MATALVISFPIGLASSPLLAADRDTHSTDTRTTATDTHTRDADLEARLEEARSRLEEAAHEVAELTGQMSGDWVDKFMVLDDEGPSRAVIGVQLDPESGKEGARIQEVSPGGPAEDAGLRAGDVITAIDGTAVKSENTARRVMHLMRKVTPESKVNVRVIRDGKSREFVVTSRRGATFLGMNQPFVAPLPPLPPGAPDGPHIRTFGPVMIHGPLGDMELATLTPQLGRYFGTDKGVLVVRAPKDFKLEDGDVILAIDGREPNSGSHATRILASYQPGEKVSIKVMRQQKTMNVDTTLPERHTLDLPPPGRDAGGRDRKTRTIARDLPSAST
jgi:membrane-associated protease RseP (regulator of RpoE activity)